MPTIQQLFDLSGRVALVTGASGYLGKALANGLAECGAVVVCASREISRAEAAAGTLASVPGGTHRAVCIDHLSSESIEAGFAAAVKQVGRLDILVNNGSEMLGDDWTTVDFELFSRQLSNAAGYFLLARLLHHHAVVRQSPANVIMLGSMYGVVASYPEAYEGVCPASPVAYHALKGGVVQMTRHLGVYWARDRVRVNCLSPGPFPNPDKVSPRLVERLAAKSPMGRMGQPHELKGAVAFLASDASSYMTGQNLLIDGGWTAW